MSAVVFPEPAVEKIPPQNGIEEKVAVQLRKSAYYAIRNTSCTCQNGVAVLHGCVGSFFLKQVAQTIVQDVEGVTQIVNRISVAM